MKRTLTVMMMVVGMAAFAATPTISNVKAQQRYPWNGLVDIDYTITGDTTGFNLSFSASDEQNDKTYTPATFLASPSAAEGTHRVTWSPKGDGLSIISTNIVVTVLLTRTVAPPEPTGEHDKVLLWEGGPYWATTNIGAEKPWDYGYYFWWGDTVGYTRSGGTLNGNFYSDVTWVSSVGQQMSSSPFLESSCPTYGKDISALQSAGYIDSTTNLVAAHDAAHVHWGGNWRMPTKQELEDLNSKCEWVWTTQNGVQGYFVKGKGTYASASIFLPCAGCGYGTSLYNAGSGGYYWSSVPDLGKYDAWDLSFYSGYHGTSSYYRSRGQSVRPVQGFTE